MKLSISLRSARLRAARRPSPPPLALIFLLPPPVDCFIIYARRADKIKSRSLLAVNRRRDCGKFMLVEVSGGDGERQR